eukprot:1177937-Prorocentrum_minimum.AAC.5
MLATAVTMDTRSVQTKKLKGATEEDSRRSQHKHTRVGLWVQYLRIHRESFRSELCFASAAPENERPADRIEKVRVVHTPGKGRVILEEHSLK